LSLSGERRDAGGGTESAGGVSCATPYSQRKKSEDVLNASQPASRERHYTVMRLRIQKRGARQQPCSNGKR